MPLLLRWVDSPIYFLKFNSPELQEASLARIGIFSEGGGKIAPGLYPSLPADGHDYRVSDLGRFFTEAEKTKTTLNPIEERLLQALLKAGLLQRHRDEATRKYTYITGKNAAVVSVAGTDKPTLSHELNHAVYFSYSKFRAQVVRLYQSGLGPKKKNLSIKSCVASQDPANTTLKTIKSSFSLNSQHTFVILMNCGPAI